MSTELPLSNYQDFTTWLSFNHGRVVATIPTTFGEEFIVYVLPDADNECYAGPYVTGIDLNWETGWKFDDALGLYRSHETLDYIHDSLSHTIKDIKKRIKCI